MLGQIIHFLVGCVLILSLLTVFFGLLLLVMRTYKKKRGADILKTLTAITGVLTAAGALWVKASGAHVAVSDDGRDAVVAFYRHIAAKDFPQAFDFIHPDRKEEMKKQNRGYEDFKNAYTSTGEYRNLQVSLDRVEGDSVRWYLAAYDVKDSFPLNTLREESWIPSSALFDSGVVDQQKVVNIIVADLRRNYALQDDSIPKVVDYIRRAPTHYLFEPSFIEDVADTLGLSSRQGSTKDSWSHHIEHLEMQESHGWKIRAGLHPPIFVGQYPPGVDPPVVLRASTNDDGTNPR